MPVRIYALAKELDLDSKDLVDLIKKAGITGKGSALASLSDEEAQQVRSQISGGATEAAPKSAPTMTKEAPTAPVKPVRDLGSMSGRRPPTIRVGRAARPTSQKSDDSKSADSEAAGSKDNAAAETPAAPPAAETPSGPAAETTSKPAAETPSKSDADSASPSDQTVTPTRPTASGSPNRDLNAVGSSGSGSGSGGKPGGGKPGPLARTPKLAPPPRGGAAAPTGPTSNSPRPEATIDERPSEKPAESAPQRPAASGRPGGAPGSLASRIADRMASNSGGRVVPNTPGSPVAPLRREPPTGREGGGIRSLDKSPSRGDGGGKGEAGKGDGGKKKREPRIKINLAQLPNTPAPAKPSGSSGAAPAQKPDIKLTRDVIEGHKQGMKAPLERLEQDEEKKRTKRPPVAPGTERRKEVEEEERPRKKGLAGMASARAERSRGGGGRRGAVNTDMERGGRRYRPKLKRKGTNTAAPRKDKVTVELPCTVRSFSEASGVSVAQVMKTLMGMGMMVNINAELDFETAELIATELQMDIELRAAETLEDELITQIEEQEDDPDSLIARPPIVTFLGHVDHGKTSLLDHLIGINVVKGEAGGITQHIRAYEVEKDGRSVTFVDTPGHEAFTEMRARGANVTDIAVLVIAADDGIMPQTEEAISHAKAAEVPIVVALNKCDLEGVDANRVMTQLTEHHLTPSEWGGDVEVVRTSAITGQGMDELLETLLTVAELHEYQANPNRKALGVCLEAEQQGDRGVMAKLVVRNGTLRQGDILVCGPSHGRVRAMTNTLTGKPITEAGPSTPVSLLGLDQAPGAGDRFHVLDDIGQAREIAASREHESSRQNLSGVTTKVSFDSFQEMLLDGKLSHGDERVKLNLIVRADVKGSLEAIDKELSKLDHPEVEIRILQRSVGGITLADVTLASASDAVVVGFNVIPDEQARSLADQRGVEVRRYDVIYKLTDDIRAMIEGRLKPEERVVELGRALVKQVFTISRVGTIAGCYVAHGSIQRGCRIRVNREGRTIGDYPLDTLRRIKEDVKEVPRGMECGIRLAGFNDVKQDDVLEAYRIEEVARTLD